MIISLFVKTFLFASLSAILIIILLTGSSLSSPQCGLASDVIHSRCDVGADDLASFVLFSSLHLFSWCPQLCLNAFTSGVICSCCVLNPGENWTGYAGTWAASRCRCWWSGRLHLSLWCVQLHWHPCSWWWHSIHARKASPLMVDTMHNEASWWDIANTTAAFSRMQRMREQTANDGTQMQWTP